MSWFSKIQTKSTGEARVNEIDLLRFIAALAVVFFHYAFRGHAADDMTLMSYPMLSTLSKYGYFGVSLFFIISGFVILMTAEKVDVSGFIVSRIARLYPALWFCCSTTMVVMLLIGGTKYSVTFTQYIINMLTLNPLFKTPFVDGAYWTLFVEMHFYALVAMVLFFKKLHHVQMLLWVWILITVALEILPDSMLRDIFITRYSVFFIAGAAYYLIWSKGLSASRVTMVVLAWALGSVQSVKLLKSFDEHYKVHMSRPGVVLLLTSFFVVMGLVSLRRTGMLGRRRWLLLGVLTYPLYLIHENVGFMVFNLAYGAINIHFLFWGMILAVLLFAYLTHVSVEKRLAPGLKKALPLTLGWVRSGSTRLKSECLLLFERT